jgi:spoIIIJ-associated protein
VSEKRYTLLEAGPKIEGFLQPLLKQARLNVKYQVCEGETRHPDFENPDIVVKFTGPDVELLLANKAEVMLALEQLTMEVLRMPPEEHSRLCFDANDYRMLRIEELRVSAVTAADRVKRSGMPFRFNPMNSRERRIIHLALRGEATVRSESVGLGPQRQVVIYPAGMPSQPFEAAPAPAGAMRRGSRRR